MSDPTMWTVPRRWVVPSTWFTCSMIEAYSTRPSTLEVAGIGTRGFCLREHRTDAKLGQGNLLIRLKCLKHIGLFVSRVNCNSTINHILLPAVDGRI